MTDSIGSATADDPTDAESVGSPAPERTPDLEVILSLDEPLVLSAGTPDEYRVIVAPLKTREFFALMKFLTRGLGPMVGELALDGDDEAMVGELVALLLIAVPAASDEFMEFVQTVCRPVGTDKREVARVEAALRNPEIDDLLLIAERIATQEAPNINRLVGKVQTMWSRLAKVYAKNPIAGLSGRSQPPST